TISQEKRCLGQPPGWVPRTKGRANGIPSFCQPLQDRLRPEPVGKAVILRQHYIIGASAENGGTARLMQVQRAGRYHNLPSRKSSSFRSAGAQNEDLQLVTTTLCFPGVQRSQNRLIAPYCG